MTEPLPIAAKRYISFPIPEPSTGPLRSKLHHLVGAAGLPVGLAASWLLGGIGLPTRMDCFRLAQRAFRGGHTRAAVDLLAFPMDSFRYFELSFLRSVAESLSPQRYLDVSSPRLVPLMLLERDGRLTGDLINPINSDLQETVKLSQALGLSDRVRPQSVLIEDAQFPQDTFDLITSVSVIEHIPEDANAIESIWRLLKPGGKLILTVPCARVATEEYTNIDEYELFDRMDEQFVFWQRYYDRTALQSRIWDITGPPESFAIFGEKVAGSYDRNVMRKRSFANYPYWREPLMMAREYTYFDSVEALPGMGVIGMVFTKRSPSEGA